MSAEPLADAVDILAALVGFDTTSRNSNLALVEWVEAYLGRLGVESRRVYNDEGSKANLIAVVGPAGRPGYVLSGHTDVVPVDGQAWASDPFTLTRRGDRLYGRGATDMKGYLACVLASVPLMLAAPLRDPFVLAFSYDEEVGCLGAPRLVEDLVTHGPGGLACFVGEPSNMNVVIGHKSKRSFSVDVRGLTAHSSLAPRAVNALEYAALVVARIRAIGRRLAAPDAPRDEMYDVAVTTAHTGTFHSGSALNIVPDFASFDFEFRGLGGADLQALVDEVLAYAGDELEPEMRAIHADAGFEFRERARFPGLETDPDAPVVALAKALARKNGHSKVAYGTEAGIFSTAGIPTVVIGPGSITEAHIEDEYIDEAELTHCLAFLARLVAHARA